MRIDGFADVFYVVVSLQDGKDKKIKVWEITPTTITTNIFTVFI